MPVPTTMRAMLLTGHGGPEMLQYRTDVPVSMPQPGEVLVKVGACGMNNTDIWVREGAYGKSDDPDAVASFTDDPLEFPIIQGADIAGSIAAVGADVDPARIGERVIVDFGIYPDDDPDTPSFNNIGSARPGGFADYVAVPAENAHAVDTTLTDAELATFCCAYVTGEHLLNRARVQPGERVLVTGASGGVGSGVVQLCRARGAIPYAVVSSAKAAAVCAIGAEATVARDGDNFRQDLAAALQGAKLDVVIDTVAGPLLPELLNALPNAGRYAICGAIGGAIVQIDARRIYLKNLDILGGSQGSRQDFARVLDYVLSGRIKPLLAATYPLRDLPHAQADFKKKGFVGKLVIDLSLE